MARPLAAGQQVQRARLRRVRVQRLPPSSGAQVGRQRRAGTHGMHAALRVRRIDCAWPRRRPRTPSACDALCSVGPVAMKPRSSSARPLPASQRGAAAPMHNTGTSQATRAPSASIRWSAAMATQAGSQQLTPWPVQRMPCALHHRTGAEPASSAPPLSSDHARARRRRRRAAAGQRQRQLEAGGTAADHHDLQRVRRGAAKHAARSAARSARSAARTGRARARRGWRRGPSPARCRSDSTS